MISSYPREFYKSSKRKRDMLACQFQGEKRISSAHRDAKPPSQRYQTHAHKKYPRAHPFIRRLERTHATPPRSPISGLHSRGLLRIASHRTSPPPPKNALADNAYPRCTPAVGRAGPRGRDNADFASAMLLFPLQGTT